MSQMLKEVGEYFGIVWDNAQTMLIDNNLKAAVIHLFSCGGSSHTYQ